MDIQKDMISSVPSLPQNQIMIDKSPLLPLILDALFPKRTSQHKSDK